MCEDLVSLRPELRTAYLFDGYNMGRKTMVTRRPKVSVRLCQREYHGGNRDESITLVACIIVAIPWPPKGI